MSKRFASIVELKRQPNQLYLVAEGCPHSRPCDAPFRACMVSVKTEIKRPDDGCSLYARLATCEFLVATFSEEEEDVGGRDFIAVCNFYGEHMAHEAAPVGMLGLPTVTHSEGESDGGEPD